MKLYFSDFFEVSEDVIEEYGAYNISLVADLPLFIDPFLLFTSGKTEYKQLHDKIIEYLIFLKRKSIEGKLTDGLIKAWFRFPEVKQNWLGYSTTDNDGRGLGPKFAKSLNKNLSNIFGTFGSQNRITEGSHLEKLCLIDKRIGRDNISDFTANLIKEYLLNFTQEFAKRYIAKKYREVHAVKKVTFNYETESWMGASFELPTYNDDFVLLTPIDLLTKEEIWISRPELVSKFRKIAFAVPNDVLREQLTNYFEKKLKEISKKEEPSQKDKTQAINETILEYPEILDYFIKAKEESGREAENLSSLRVNESKQMYLKQFSQLASKLSLTTSFYEISPKSYSAVKERLNLLKSCIEKNGGNSIFYFNDEPIQSEDNLSILFRLTWKANQTASDKKISDEFLDILTVWKDSKKELKLLLKSASNPYLINTLDKLKDKYDENSSEQKFILVIFYFSDEELNSVQFLLKRLEMDEYKNVYLINLSKQETSEENSEAIQETPKEVKAGKVNKEFKDGYALLVGVGADLPVTVKDATVLRDILINPHRAAYPHKQVALLTQANASRKSILETFDKLIEQSNKNPNATVIIYYSGHGGRLSLQNEYFLVPYGFNGQQLEETGITGQEFTDKIQAIKAKKVIVFLDCCHAGGISSIKGIEETFEKSPVPPDLINALSQGSGRIIIASSREDEYSYTGNPYSVFTNYLVQALSGKGTKNFDGFAKILDILSYLFEKVPEHTSGKQHPFIPHIGNLSDNFPVCYYAGGSKQIEGISESRQADSLHLPNDLTEGERSRLQNKLQGLQEQYDLLDEKIKRLRKQVSIEAGASNKFQLEKELLDAETEQSNIETKMTDIERKLNQVN